jgi:hypothetical protein
MHHDSINDLPEELKRQLFNERSLNSRPSSPDFSQADPYLRIEGLGKTGKHPEGKYTETDEGEIAFSVAADKKNKKVLVDFGTPVVRFGMDAAQARQLAKMLMDKADELELATIELRCDHGLSPSACSRCLREQLNRAEDIATLERLRDEASNTGVEEFRKEWQGEF